MIRKRLMDALVVAVVLSCLSILACGKKGHCARCSSNSECDSGICTEFSDGNNKSLLCANSVRGSETCSVPR